MNTTRNRIILAVVVVVLVIAAWFLGKFGVGAVSGKAILETSTQQSASPTKSSNGADVASVHTTVVQGDESVSAKDQPAGSSVAVESVSLSQAGWVAVRDSDGRVLGAAWFPAGSQSGVSVPLLRATEKGQNYQVLLYTDDGDKAFDIHKDTIIVDQGGNVIGTTITAQ